MPEITSKVLIHNLNPMTQKSRPMHEKIRYIGRNKDENLIYKIMDIKDALEKGKSFTTENGYEMNVCDLDTLCFYMHRHCRFLDVKMNPEHKFTIKELYNLCPAILLDLLELNGGIDYIAKVLTGYEHLYNQDQIVKQWQENQQL